MKMYALVTAVCVVLTACNHNPPLVPTPPEVRIVEVKVPVVVYPEIKDIPPRPTLQLDTLPSTLDTPQQIGGIVNALVDSIVQLMVYSRQLENILNTINKPPEGSTK